MYIPDLFGAYIKGRELAIEKNWQDLKNYEAVEHARNQNDLEALQILGERADFGGKRSMFQDQVNKSKRGDELGELAQPGLVAITDMRSRFAKGQRGVYLEHEPEVLRALADTLKAQVGSQIVGAGIQNANNKSWTLDRQNDAGQAQANVVYNTIKANGVASTDYVGEAQRQNAQNAINYAVNMATANGQLMDANNYNANREAINALYKAQIGNALLGQATVNQDMMGKLYSNYIAYLQAAQAGDKMAEQAAASLAEQFGFSPPTYQTDPTGKTLIPTPSKQANNAQAATDNLTAQLREQIAVNYPYLAAPQPVTSTPVTSTPVTSTPVAKSSLFGGALGITGTIPRP